MTDILVIAPHPDDETLGCGGTILKHIANGDKVHWCIVTQMDNNYPIDIRQKRADEIQKVANAYNFINVHQLNFAPAQLDIVPKSELVGAIKKVFQKVAPEIVYLPFSGDVHSDHAYAFDAASASLKWFRQKSVKRALCYETISETNFQINPLQNRFNPNVYVDIEEFFNKKIDIMKIYESEIEEFPFPRSVEALEALAKLRGTACGARSAEAFILLKEIL